jgi:hypothetical protein
MPEPPRSEYETWVDEVWPAYVEAAAAGRRFVCWEIAREKQLSNPPDQQRDWARLMGDLHRADIVEPDGFGYARDHSAVQAWRGTRAAQQGRAA